MESLIINGISISLAGMLVAAFISVFKNSFKASNSILLLSNIIGLVSGIAYLLNFSSQELIVAQFSFWLDFKFTLNFLSAVFFTLVNAVAGIVVFYGFEYLERYKKVYDANNVQLLNSLFIFGMASVLLSSNALGFMVFWEAMSVASFFLVMADKKTESARAAFIYFIMTHLGAGAILGGFLILSHSSLAFSLNDIAAATKNISPVMLSASFGLFLFGFGSKAGLIPLHIWLPEAHPQAPTNISALMSGLMLKIAVFGFLKIILSFAHLPSWASGLVIALGIISAFFGALYAAVSRDIKKAFAYSSIENMGIVFTMLGVAMLMFKSNAAGAHSLGIFLIAFAIFHSINHAIFKTGLFLSSGVIINKIHSKSLEKMGGIAKAMPFFSFAFLIVILASTALPPFGTFYGEWGFIRTLINILQIPSFSAMNEALVIGVLSLFALVSGLAIFAMIKIYAISMLGLPRTKIHDTESGDDKMLIAPIAVLGLLTVSLGIFASRILNFIALNIDLMISSKVRVADGIAISSPKVFAAFAIFLLLAFIFHKIFSKNNGKQREYQTWDCGQPIDQSMEYTATAFSAPIRFFFLLFLQRQRELVSVPVISTNKWIIKNSYKITFRSLWQEKFYKPAAKSVFWLADKIRLIHTGRIQYYLLLLLATVIITLIIAL